MENHQPLLPGFRFYPTEEELIDFYLNTKLHSPKPEIDQLIPSIDLYNFEPSQLPGKAGERSKGDSEQWFFFVVQQEREARGGRPNRTTATGYWKATGSPSYVYSSNTKVIGVKKTMVFYKGKAPMGSKTKWKMNEYKAIIHDDVNNNDPSFTSTFPKVRNEISLCRVYVTSGCARAFDRRPPQPQQPPPPAITQIVNASTWEVGQGSGTKEATNATTTDLNIAEKSIISSTNDSSNNSSGHRIVPQTSTNNACEDFEMTESLDFLVDWEHLDFSP
ncbi:hypothetical protein RND81_05G253200 [Saponaria officinalis]|uniref:NAC domain-containing protein n=1 Tax=Saponaria officinalis TaxID=3572 RepID=A0AAW1KZS2_SAPOF